MSSQQTSAFHWIDGLTYDQISGFTEKLVDLADALQERPKFPGADYEYGSPRCVLQPWGQSEANCPRRCCD